MPTVALTDYDVAPLEFLFSEDGQSIYSATSYRRDDPLDWIRENGLTIVVVYDDETVRLAQIEKLRKNSSLPFRVGVPQHLENIKYTVINFFGPSGRFVRDVEYFEPKACVSAEEEKSAKYLMDYESIEIWKMQGLHGTKTEPNWVTGFFSPYLIVAADGNPLYVKIHNVMAEKVKAYLALSAN